MAEAKQNKMYIQIKSIKTAMQDMFTQVDNIYTTKNYTNDTRRKLTSTAEVLKRKYTTLQRTEEKLIDILTEENDIEQFYAESTRFEILFQETIALIEDIVIECPTNKPNTTTPIDIIRQERTNNEQNENNADSTNATNENVTNRSTTQESRPNVRLPKLEMHKFKGDHTKWQSFIDTFEASIDSSPILSNIEKFHYLTNYIEGDALNTIQGLRPTNENCKKALDLLKERYGNKQAIITAHVNNLLRLRRVESDKNVIGLRKLYDDVQAQVRSLQSLGIEEENYGSFLAPIILERLPHEVELNINRNLNDELWNLTRLLNIIKLEINAREKCTNNLEEKEKGGKNQFISSEPVSAHGLFAGQKSKPQCIFCNKNHWSDKCRTISEPNLRKEFLKKGGYCFLCLSKEHRIRECKKKKGCFYCKGPHNSAICTQRDNKDKKEEGDNKKLETAVNHIQSQLSSAILLQTADLILENPHTNKQIKVKVLFDPGAQRSYITERVKKISQSCY